MTYFEDIGRLTEIQLQEKSFSLFFPVFSHVQSSLRKSYISLVLFLKCHGGQYSLCHSRHGAFHCVVLQWLERHCFDAVPAKGGKAKRPIFETKAGNRRAVMRRDIAPSR